MTFYASRKNHHPLRLWLLATVLGFLTMTSAWSQLRTEETVTTTDSTGTSTVKVVKVTDSEDIRQLQNMVTIDPFKLFSLFNVSYYRAFTPTLVAGATLQTPVSFSNENIKGVGLHLHGQFYPGQKTFRGFLMGANVSYDMVSYDEYETGTGPTTRTDHPFALGVMVGWNWWPFDEMVVQMEIQGNYTINSTDAAIAGLLGSAKEGMTPGFGFKVGYAW